MHARAGLVGEAGSAENFRSVDPPLIKYTPGAERG